jgi:hypothetical protein
MSVTPTEKKLAAITDVGLFEKLATAVLRAADPVYRALVHTGLNADGKTVRSPADGICYRLDCDPPRQIIVHHTTTARAHLREKWLHDPAKATRPQASAGDVVKAAALAAEARAAIPGLATTVVLTTNHEPDLALVTEANVIAYAAGLTLDIWPSSRLADVLDNRADGQWLRRQYLGDTPSLLSRAWLQELSRESLGQHRPRDSADIWIARELDTALAKAARRETTFLLAPSGLGKSVASYKWLSDHIERGGVGMVLPHTIVAQSATLVDAIRQTLQQLAPTLGPSAGEDALALASEDDPLCIVVEDVNRSGEPVALVERIENWSRLARESRTPIHYRLVCPVWPDVVAAVPERAHKAVLDLALVGGSLTPAEGRRAVQKRTAALGVSVSDMDADAVSASLGHDPLLIALSDPARPASVTAVLGDFVASVVTRVAASERDFAPTDYLRTLYALAGAALCARDLNPSWSALKSWPGLEPDGLRRLAHLIHDGALLHLTGAAADQRLGYRHDRVRDWLLVEAAHDMAVHKTLPDAVLNEPYFAEIIGRVAVRGVTAEFLQRIATGNPLALFYALRAASGAPAAPPYPAVLTAINAWLDSKASEKSRAHFHLRWDALAILAQTESPDIVALVARFGEQGWTPWQARLRNGDISGGIELCYRVEPRSSAAWRDIQIDHAKQKFGHGLSAALDKFLRKADLAAAHRLGAVRLAGHIGDPALGDVILVSWQRQEKQSDYVDDYFWAAAQCCGDHPARLLDPLCSAWAALPDTAQQEHHTPPRFAISDLKWAFARRCPEAALTYLIARAQQDDLRWPIMHLLDALDHPTAVCFVAQEIAFYSRRAQSTGGHSIVGSMVSSHWQMTEDRGGTPMSDASRSALQALWIDQKADEHLRRAAFALWAATMKPDDLALLRQPHLPDDLVDSIFYQRVRRGDRTTIPGLIDRVKTDPHPWWVWHSMRHVLSDELLPVLRQELAARAKTLATDEAATKQHNDHSLAHLIERLAPEQAEQLLAAHWPQLQRIDDYVHAAVVIGTPRLRAMAAEAVSNSADPAALMKNLNHHVGLKDADNAAITREAQIVSLAPYLANLPDYEVTDLRSFSQRNGWHIARDLLDAYLRTRGGAVYVDETPTFAALDDMVAKKRTQWIDQWLQDYAKTGATADMIMTQIGAWYGGRRTVEARKLLHAILRHGGRRKDLALLEILPIEDVPDDADRCADTIFAVRRRGLI